MPGLKNVLMVSNTTLNQLAKSKMSIFQLTRSSRFTTPVWFFLISSGEWSSSWIRASLCRNAFISAKYEPSAFTTHTVREFYILQRKVKLQQQCSKEFIWCFQRYKEEKCSFSMTADQRSAGRMEFFSVTFINTAKAKWTFFHFQGFIYQDKTKTSGPEQSSKQQQH